MDQQRHPRRRPARNSIGLEQRERQRHHVRHTFVRFQRKILCFPCEHRSQQYPLRNIHTEGISFRSLMPLKIGNKIKLFLETSVLVHSFCRECCLAAKVVWVDKLPKKTYWRIGCKLVGNIPAQELQEFIRDGVVISKAHSRKLF